VFLYADIYIYIYIYRERERDREGGQTERKREREKERGRETMYASWWKKVEHPKEKHGSVTSTSQNFFTCDVS